MLMKVYPNQTFRKTRLLMQLYAQMQNKNLAIANSSRVSSYAIRRELYDNPVTLTF